LTRQWKFERLKHFFFQYYNFWPYLTTKWRIVHLKVHFNRHFTQTRPTENISLERIRKTCQIQKKITWWLLLITKLMSRSYRDISCWPTIRIMSRRIDTVSIYRHIVSSLISRPIPHIILVLLSFTIKRLFYIWNMCKYIANNCKAKN